MELPAVCRTLPITMSTCYDGHMVNNNNIWDLLEVKYRQDWLTYALPVLRNGEEGQEPGRLQDSNHQVPWRVEDQVPASQRRVKVGRVGQEGEKVLPQYKGGEDTARVNVQQRQDQAGQRMLPWERFPS